jgi:hypothetical protein
MPLWQRRSVVLAAVAVIAVLTGLVSITWPTRRGDVGFNVYRNQMTGIALVGYGMDLPTNNLADVQAYLAQHGAPANYNLPATLKNTTLTGCAIKSWLGAKVSMICFQSGKPLPPGQSSDVWFFVVNRNSVLHAPTDTAPIVTRVNRATTATWSEGDNLYVLVTDGDENFLKKYL